MVRTAHPTRGVMARLIGCWLAIAGPVVAANGCAATGEAQGSGSDQVKAAPPAPMSIGWSPPPFDDRTVVLFDGRSWEAWTGRDGQASPWEVQTDGSVRVRGGDAVTRRQFGDFQLHLEFYCPVMTQEQGQTRANSGVYLHGRYEVQVLDSFGQPPAANGCGALYSIAAPLVNASRPPGHWQTYDITFRGPRFDEVDALLEPPRVTVLHNGIVIHNNLALPQTTPGGLDRDLRTVGPILLQDHGDPVRYRNIWVRSLD